MHTRKGSCMKLLLYYNIYFNQQLHVSKVLGTIYNITLYLGNDIKNLKILKLIRVTTMTVEESAPHLWKPLSYHWNYVASLNLAASLLIEIAL